MIEPIGYILGTKDATPLEFWVAVCDGKVLRLDDVVQVKTDRPDKKALLTFMALSIMSELSMKERNLILTPS